MENARLPNTIWLHLKINGPPVLFDQEMGDGTKGLMLCTIQWEHSTHWSQPWAKTEIKSISGSSSLPQYLLRGCLTVGQWWEACNLFWIMSEADIRSRNTTEILTTRHLTGRASWRSDSISSGRGEMWTAWSRLGLKQWEGCQRKQRIKMEATDTRRDYSTYKERTNNYKPTVTLPLISWSGVPLHVQKAGGTWEFFFKYRTSNGNILSAQALTLNFYSGLFLGHFFFFFSRLWTYESWGVNYKDEN